MPSDKDRAFLVEAGHRQPSLLEVLRPRPFEILEIVCVVHHPAAVGIFIIYLNVHTFYSRDKRTNTTRQRLPISPFARVSHVALEVQRRKLRQGCLIDAT